MELPNEMIVNVVSYLDISNIYRDVCGVSQKFREISIIVENNDYRLVRRKKYLCNLYNLYKKFTENLGGGTYGDLRVILHNNMCLEYLDINKNNITTFGKIWNINNNTFKSFVEGCDSIMEEYYTVGEFLGKYYRFTNYTEYGRKYFVYVFNMFKNNGLIGYDEMKNLNEYIGVEFTDSIYNSAILKYDSLNGKLTLKGYLDMCLYNIKNMPVLVYNDIKSINAKLNKKNNT